MDIDPKEIRIVLGRSKTGRVYAASTPQAPPPETEDPLSRLFEQSDEARSPRRPDTGTDGDTPLAWDVPLLGAQGAERASSPLPAFIELCQTPEDYSREAEAAVQAGALSRIPVLVSRYGAEVFAGVERPPEVERKSPEAHRVCIALDEGVCREGALLLAAFTGRALCLTHADDWEGKLAELFADRALSNVTVMLPYWSSEGRLDPRWLSLATRLLSEHATPQDCPSVGMITGPDPGSFTHNVAKALLADRIAVGYRAKPGIMVAPGEGSVTALRPLNGARPSAGLFGFPTVKDSRDPLFDERFGAAMFRGHGRSYCSCEGYLCSARAPEIDPKDACSCLFGLDCAESHFPQIDVRRYDALLTVFDTCGAGNPGSGLDDAGVPPLAILSAAARPLAVVCSRYQLRTEQQADEAQIVGAFAGARSAGEGVSRLNRMRRQAGLSGDFYLLGDPELGAETWGGAAWVEMTDAIPAEREGEWHAHLEHAEAPYACIVVKRPPPEGRWFVWRTGRGEASGPTAVLQDDGAAELWIDSPKSPDGHLDLWLACRPRRELPPGLVRSARTIQADGAWWQGPVGRELPRLVDAGRKVQECERLLSGASSAIARWNPAREDELVSQTVNGWVAAQRDCLYALVELRDELCLPWHLTGVHRTDATAQPDPCMWCGRSPTVLHTYSIAAAVERELTECSHCEASRDQPRRRAVEMRIDIEKGMCFPDPSDVELELTNTASEEVAVGSVVAFVDSGAPIRPHVSSFRLEPGESKAHVMALEFEEAPRMAKTYGLRVVVLVNNELHWLGRRWVVADGARRIATRWP